MAKRNGAVGTIQAPAVPVDKRRIRFSFEYLDLEHQRFPLGACVKEFFDALFREVLNYQKFTVDSFTQPDPRSHRHPIYFPETKEPNGFTNVDPSQDEDLWTDTPWQFGLPDGNGGQTPWRVHGFISEEAFYIVWFDPGHSLD